MIPFSCVSANGPMVRQLPGIFAWNLGQQTALVWHGCGMNQSYGVQKISSRTSRSIGHAAGGKEQD